MNSAVLLSKIFSTVFPLVAIVCLGYFYARQVKTDMSVANKINIDVFVPALIFSVVSAKSFNFMQFQSLALAATLIVLCSGLLVWPLCRFLKVHPKTLLPPMMFSNSGNLGLPLIVLAFGEQALPAAVVLFIIENGLHFTVGVYMLDHRANPLSILKMPMIMSTIAGLFVSAMRWETPEILAIPISMLGEISIPLMLFALGVRMTQVDFSSWRLGLWGAFLAPLSGIMLAFALQFFIQLPKEQFNYLILFGALPPAVLNYMVAERYQQSPQEVASIVLIGNIAALFTIPLVLFFIL